MIYSGYRALRLHESLQASMHLAIKHKKEIKGKKKKEKKRHKEGEREGERERQREYVCVCGCVYQWREISLESTEEGGGEESGPRC